MKIKIEGLVGNRLEVTSGYAKFGKYLKENISSDEKSKIRLWISPPYKKNLPVGFNAIFTMHELEYLQESKSDWVDNLNEYDLIIVPTSWNKKVFQNLGVTKPIEVVPLGVNTEIFKGYKTPEFSILTMHDNFGRDSSRENWHDTLWAFIVAFSGRKDVALYMKTWNYSKDALKRTINEISKGEKIDKDMLPTIRIIDNMFSEKELNDFISSKWLFVKNANREGWSMPLNEAVATGVTCLYSDIPALSWAKNCGAIPFKDKKELMALMIYYYKSYTLIKERLTKYNSKQMVDLTYMFIKKYYEGK